MSHERRVAQVAGGDLVRGDVELLEEVGARFVEGRREEDEPELARAGLQLDVRGTVELERLAVLAVRRTEAALVVVGAVVELAREETAVVALLELDRVDARLLREHEELLGLLDAPLVVVADLGDHEAGGVVGDPAAVDRQLAHGAIVPLRSASHGADTVRVRSEETDRVPPVADSLSILMPVFNELTTVERAIDDALTAELPVESRQLVLIDDGSTDGTRELLQGREWPETVTLVLHEKNRGKGAALRTGLQHATGAWSAVLDADLEYQASDLGPLLEPLLAGQAHVVFGTRSWASHSAYSFWYVMGNKGVTMATNVIYNCWISDVMTCHKAMSTELFRSLRLRERGFAIEPEITARVLRAGERIYEVPISYAARSREEGKKLTALDGLRVLRTLLRCRIA